MINYKISKYIYKYLNKDNNKQGQYNKKLKSYLQKGGYNYQDAMDILRYIGCIINDTNCNIHEKGNKIQSNEKPYLLILYGPPACGKTFSGEFIIKKLNLKNNYINLNVDQFVYDSNQFQESKIDLTKFQNITIDEIDKNPQLQLIEDNYRKIRLKTDFLLQILKNISIMFKYNVVLETTGGAIDFYFKYIINDYYYKKYNIYLVFPYTNNINILFDRSIERGLKECRFVPKEYFKFNFMKSQKNFLKVINKDNIIKFNGIYVYDIKKFDYQKEDFCDSILFKYEKIDNKIIKSKENDKFINQIKKINE